MKADCEVRNTVKQTTKKFPKKNLLLQDYSGLVCSDVMGPVKVPSNSGMKYVANFNLKNTKYAEVYPIRNKSEVVTKFEDFYKKSTKTKLVINRLRSDNGGEYKKKVRIV
jgi:hypothetical protein